MLTSIGRMVRLILQNRLNNTEISKQTGLARNTVSNWRKRITDKNLTFDDFEGLDDTAIQRLITPGLFNRKGNFYKPDFAAIRFEKEERNVDLSLLHDEYLDKVPYEQTGMSKTTFYREYRLFVEARSPELRFTYEAGEMIQFDFVGRKSRKWPTLYSKDGTVCDYEVGLGISTLSQKIFVKALQSQAKTPFFDFVADMFEFYGGVPLLLTVDNFKAAIKETRAKDKPAIPTNDMQEVADHYQFGLIAARVRKPRDKGLAENGVGITQGRILAPLRNRRFYSLSELNAAIKPLLDILNDEPMKTHGNERYERLDKCGFQPLPALRYEHGNWILKLRAGKDYHVFVDGNHYSVPSRLSGEPVDVKITLHTITIFRKGQVVATHKRLNGIGERSTSAFHMPANHKNAYLTRLSGAKAIVREIGPNAVDLIEQHFRRYKKPNETAKAAIRLVTLAEELHANRVDAACQRAVLLKHINPKKVEEILSSGLENFTADEDTATEEQTPSGNVRGSQYYSKILKFNKREQGNG